MQPSQPYDSGQQPQQPFGYPNAAYQPLQSYNSEWDQYTPPLKRKTGLWIGLAVVVVVLALIAGISVIAANSGSGSKGGSSAGGGYKAAAGKSTDLSSISGGNVTADALAKIDPGTLFWHMFNDVATKNVISVNQAYFQDDKSLTAHDYFIYEQHAIDHKNNKFAYQSASYSSGKADDLGRCVNGHYYGLSGTGSSWLPDDVFSSQDCVPTISTPLSDGILPSGLSKGQADDVVAALQGSKGLFTFGDLQLVQANGKSYIKVPAELHPFKEKDGHYYGNQELVFALQKAKVDPTKIFFYYGFGLGQGNKATYYLDPKTLLPVYVRTASTPPIEDNGKLSTEPQVANSQYTMFKWEFPDQVPDFTLNDTTPLPYDFPPQFEKTA